MIRNVAMHISGEQPLLVDLFGLPAAADAGVLCTNVRTTDGKRPVFIDDIHGTFFFPYLVVRFLEIPAGAVTATVAPEAPIPLRAYDERDAALPPEDRLPVPLPAPADDDADDEIELDEEFLRRIRAV